MSHTQAKHAKQVVETFKNLLSESGRQHVGVHHFDELELLIESAITSAVMEEMEGCADKMQELAQEIRFKAEHYDKPAKTA
jgi:hypothetical protein